MTTEQLTNEADVTLRLREAKLRDEAQSQLQEQQRRLEAAKAKAASAAEGAPAAIADAGEEGEWKTTESTTFVSPYAHGHNPSPNGVAPHSAGGPMTHAPLAGTKIWRRPSGST